MLGTLSDVNSRNTLEPEPSMVGCVLRIELTFTEHLLPALQRDPHDSPIN